ncbi:glutathione-dependent formaldehyde-activating gfa [Grosmannia clavigera kw1407]|uniref:Glutathione-dependent formaldehyde-activating gfa n=1 Tax=Grosmannia clavigera (strain kw1407 / UAMH 11150) TaxID=655863 RepID=F0XFG7_GROCL|nr:glutathione-dependent formaldehyde-activating gfa [Grosmannia clavigera kw1407]EFX03791.1 glutathione-dependent formaldehyde-activating gfa [Grosmannia clavigera kw1407]
MEERYSVLVRPLADAPECLSSGSSPAVLMPASAAVRTTLKMIPFDGASLPPAYVEPDYIGPEPAGGPVGDEPSKIYHGSCHCGAVRMSLRSKPLETLDPTGKIGHIGGYIWIYPTKDQSAVQGEDNLTHYSFANHVDRKSFCRTCGVHLFNIGVEYTLEEEAALPVVARSETARTGREECRDERNINTRVLHGVDVNKLPVHYLDGNGDMEPQYVNP